MYVQTIHNRRGEKTYTYHLLMEGYREGGKVKHRTLANLSRLDSATIECIRQSLKGNKPICVDDLEAGSGRSYGALFAICAIAQDLGITQALGEGKRASLVLLMAAARIVIQGSKLACSHWAKGQATREVLGAEPPSEDELYSAMDWVLANQVRIEDEIFAHRQRQRKGGRKPTLFLYDVTSSYLEGECNELADYGYNRDKKKGKKQIVVGLLTDSEGFPVSVQVFPGSTQDIATLPPQIDKVARRFGAGKVALVGDKGMIKSTSVKEIKKQGFFYITSISKPEIEALAQAGIIQLSLFDAELCEVEDSEARYILRRNPRRAEEASCNRKERLAKALSQLEEEAKSLSSSQRKSPQKAYDRMVVMLDKLRLSKFVKLSLSGRELSFGVNEEALAKAEALDGCYCLKTDLPKEDMSAEKVHDRYKDLALVERAFRDLKTALLEIGPLNHRKGNRTRAHALICMLSLMLTHEMRRRMKDSKIPLEHAVRSLDRLQVVPLTCGDYSFELLARPDPEQVEILKTLKLSLPSSIDEARVAKKTG